MMEEFTLSQGVERPCRIAKEWWVGTLPLSGRLKAEAELWRVVFLVDSNNTGYFINIHVFFCSTMHICNKQCSVNNYKCIIKL